MQTIVYYNFVVPCGFPSPAADSVEEPLNMQKYLVEHPASTCCVRCSGDSMSGAMITEGDVLVVDRQIKACDGDIVLAMYDGAFLVKRLRLKNGCAILHPENPSYRDIVVTNPDSLTICGVVTAVVRKFKKQRYQHR